jgi:hypothetical protein
VTLFRRIYNLAIRDDMVEKPLLEGPHATGKCEDRIVSPKSLKFLRMNFKICLDPLLRLLPWNEGRGDIESRKNRSISGNGSGQRKDISNFTTVKQKAAKEERSLSEV